jgi:hypothetical protein
MLFANWKFKEVDIYYQNWFSDPRIGCKSPSNLIEFLKKDINFKKKLKEFEGEFERDEVVEV